MDEWNDKEEGHELMTWYMTMSLKCVNYKNFTAITSKPLVLNALCGDALLAAVPA